MRAFLLLTIILLSRLPAAAQGLWGVPFDSAGTLEAINAPLERELQLFGAVPGFLEARLFQRPDSSYVLEISSEVNGRLAREHRALSPAGLDTLRAQLRARLGTRRVAPPALEDARGRFLVGITTLSLGYYGWALPVALEIEDGQTAGGLYLLTSAAGFFVPYTLTRGRFVPEGAAALGLYGGTRGIAYGMLLATAVKGARVEGRMLLGAGVATSLAGVVGGYQAGWASRMSAGRAGAIGVYGDFGLFEGAMAGALLDEDWLNADNASGVAGVTLLGGVAGLTAGTLLSDRQSYSRGDNAVVRTTGLLGIAVPVMLLDLAGDVELQSFAAVTMAGAALGAAGGHALTREVDFSTNQGTLIELGALGGALLGLGIAYIADAGEQSEPYLILGTVSAAGGFYLTYRSMLRAAPAATGRSAWDVELSPAGLLALAARRQLPERLPLPLLRLGVWF